MKCELCKCLNIIKEGKKHPSRTVWIALTNKFQLIQQRNPKAIASFCHVHRNPLMLATDYQSISEFIEEVFTTIENYLNKVDKLGNYKFGPANEKN
jgi:hypothetical protein